MKILNVLTASFLLATAPALAQNEYVWSTISNVTGKAAAAWSDNTNFDVRVSILSGGAWSDPVILPNSSSTFPDPICIEMDSLGNIIVVWGDSYNGLIMSSIKPVLGDWTNSAVISPLSEYSTEPVLTIDPSGNATALWLNYAEGLQSTTLPVGTTTWPAPTNVSQ